MTDLSSNISIITLNVNVLNAPFTVRDWQNGSKNMTNYTLFKTHSKHNYIGTSIVKFEKDIIMQILIFKKC